MSYNSKNYTEQGGERTVIGGELVIKSGAKLVFAEGAESEGVVPQADNQAESTATTVAGLKDDLNALIGKLISAGLMAPAE